MSKFAYFATFVMGAALGSFVTWRCIKNKYEKIAQDEIDSVKEVFSKRNDISENTYNDDDFDKTELIYDYAEMLQKTGYNYNSYGKKAENKEGNKMMEPYVISPDEFGEIYDYEKISLNYYSDGILTDEDDEIIDDVEDIIGSEALNSFGEFEDDSVFVRNDAKKCDYEILLDYRTYEDVLKVKPYLRREER